jgi:N-acetylated-alpha-linked acidic dipeptidase
MGSGSDFTAFQDFAGVASLDMAFSSGPESAVYHYHSNYDSYDWMKKYGDPSFEYHTTIAKVWGLVAANLIENPVIQFNATEYALGLRSYVNSLKDKAAESSILSNNDDAPFAPLDKALERFQIASEAHDAVAGALEQRLDDIPWWKWWERVQLYYAIRKANTKYKLLERKFLYAEGLDGRPWFKHIVFAPGKWTGYSGATFPGIVEGIDEKDREGMVKWIGIAARTLEGAAEWLE